jgi:hypothetical protein
MNFFHFFHFFSPFLGKKMYIMYEHEPSDMPRRPFNNKRQQSGTLNNSEAQPRYNPKQARRRQKKNATKGLGPLECLYA